MNQKLKVRCAPSPSGTLHVGNCKTFLFNFLFAKRYDADFILRIEDTDQSRAVQNGAEHILEDLNWLGLKPNVGYGTSNKPAKVYTQMERLPIYKQYADKLLQEGKAYKCYCSQEDLDKAREDALAKNPKAPFKYPGTCRNAAQDLDKNYVIRLKTTTEGYTEFDDLVFGHRKMSNKENYDFVIFRQNGIPLFNFANAIDDGIIDEITHVIRGRDHIVNNVIQILIYEALGIKRPIFAHLCMLLNNKGEKLSKRDGSVSVREFRELGFTPQAILNYIVRFGWGCGNQEIFSLTEMIEKFNIEDVRKSDGKFDFTKFSIINYEHLKSVALTPSTEYARLLKPFIDRKKIGDFSEEDLIPFIAVIRSRAKTLVEAAAMLEPMLTKNMNPEIELLKKSFTDETLPRMEELKGILNKVDIWTEDGIRNNVQTWLTDKNLTFKDIGAPLRIALLGQPNSPELFQVLNALGKKTSVDRLNQAIVRSACR